MGVRGRAANVVGNLFSGRAAQSCSAAEPSPLRCGREVYLAAEPLNHFQRPSRSPLHFQRPSRSTYMNARVFLFKRAHMKRDSYFSMHNVLASAYTNAVHGDIPYGRIQAATP